MLLLTTRRCRKVMIKNILLEDGFYVNVVVTLSTYIKIKLQDYIPQHVTYILNILHYKKNVTCTSSQLHHAQQNIYDCAEKNMEWTLLFLLHNPLNFFLWLYVLFKHRERFFCTDIFSYLPIFGYRGISRGTHLSASSPYVNDDFPVL